MLARNKVLLHKIHVNVFGIEFTSAYADGIFCI